MTNVLEDLKAKIQLNLMTNKPSFDYKGHTFNCYYGTYPNPLDLKNYCRIEIVMPPELRLPDFHTLMQTTVMPTTRTQYIAEQTSNAWKLADYFVEEVLPKVDYTIEKMKYERDIDRALSVLD